ncbi:epoxide hydrolase [Pseudonocardia eucalypti]|uniref:Epoxide hydrolase n=1 Tax=Pseudonocardia eucalypti TaxID=648755 RepID=A0ABP9PNP4_9PSEU|nr:pimeloyl-ACP methyl ester carboxylesterase [Pseudonocardia eucalypti]
MAQVRQFTVEITDAQIDELRQRLAQTRFPEKEPVADWSQGIPRDYLRELVDYWRNDYDMRRVATRLNAHPQFFAELKVDGVELGIHFLHIRSKHPDARPLIMTHGWPGSVLEFLEVIAPLTDPEDPSEAFHLVIPALPGYGFSAKPTVSGTGAERIARAWHQLMGELGYAEYYAQGGDWGSLVTAVLGIQNPPGLRGIHVNMALSSPAAFAELGEPTPAEQEMLGRLRHYAEQEAGYSTQQSTRPQTLGYALADSPAGQLAWIVEKFHAWTDCARDGVKHPENAVPRDVLLDNVMMYWLTNSATSSARLYWESFGQFLKEPVAVTAPSAYTRFPEEIGQASERWVRFRFPELRYYGESPRGGHFAALEQPEIFVREVRAAIGALAK